jgi:drug/metabolite transporter (DMT)-like permease
LTRFKAELILFCVAGIWGGTFVIVKLTLEDLPPFYFLGLRFCLASILFFIIFFRRFNFGGYEEVRAGLLLGILLFAGFAFQTEGLLYTTASNSALITGVNILIVPFAQYFIIKKAPGIDNWIGIIIVTLGIFLLTGPFESGVNAGDLLTLFCAVSWAFYIIYLDIFTRKFNLYILVITQLLFSGVTAIIIAFIFEKIVLLNFTIGAVLGLLYTAVPATLIATYLGNRYQKYTTPVRAALLFSFEQPSAVIIAIIFLKDSFTALQLTGGILMICGILFSETFEYIKSAYLSTKQRI